VLDRLVAAEQAVSPGEDSFGVAVLGMMYGPPIIVTAASGLLTLLLGLSFLVVHRFPESRLTQSGYSAKMEERLGRLRTPLSLVEFHPP
jgi:hypothetical protein